MTAQQFDFQSLYDSINAADASVLWDKFDDLWGMPATEAEGEWVLNKGTDAQALDPASDTAQAGGVWKFVTGDATGAVADDGSQAVWADVPIRLDTLGGILTIEARLRIKSSVATVSVFFGLTDSTALEEPFTNAADVITSVATDAVGFHYDTDATTDQWWALAVDSDVDDTGNAATGNTPVADTWQKLKIEVSANGALIKFYVNGSLVKTLSAAGVGPDVVLYPTVIANATTTTSKTIDVDYVRVRGVR